MENWYNWVIFVIPVILVVGGFILKWRPPKRNLFAGYRTKRSMRNDETWYFAQARIALFVILGGLVLAVLTFLVRLLLEINEIIVIATASVQLGVVILFIGV